MKVLSPELLRDYNSEIVLTPTEESFYYPDKVLQFGTGVLLRGLPDYFIDLANKKGIFKGRIVMVKSTSHGSLVDFEEQDNMYTVCVKGLESGVQIENYIINNSISRVVDANKDWKEILQVAINPELSVIISNTTEVGIVSSEDRVNENPPASFPGKLLSVLYHRYLFFEGDSQKGLVILPTELISDNGQKLKHILLALAEKNKLEESFIKWLVEANDFCNTLVDRIVPGKLSSEEQEIVEQQLGYRDKLTIMAEPFSLWAIESDSERVRAKLSFTQIDPSLVIVPSINKYKEIKLRLLNATHTFSCAVALLAGFSTVKEAMQTPAFRHYVETLMQNEIGPSIISEEIAEEEVISFSRSVVDRFSNPFLEHKWSAIAMNYTSKMKMRCVPLLAKWYSKKEFSPSDMALGFAAYLLLLDTEFDGEVYFKTVGTQIIQMQDECAAILNAYWNENDMLSQAVFGDKGLWDEDLYSFPQFVDNVLKYIEIIKEEGMLKVLESRF